MYDHICTDLSAAHPAMQVLGRYGDHIVPFPPVDPMVCQHRCLLVSENQQSIETAAMLGMGGLLVDADFSEQSLMPYLSWVDPPIPGECKLVIFDLGNVVVKNIQMLGKIIRRWKLDREEFIADFLKYEFPLMDGTMSCPDYWAHIEHAFGVKVEGEPFADTFEPVFNPSMVHVIKQLKRKGIRVVCASNTIGPHWTILEQMGVLALFDYPYASHLLGLTKPSKAFFRQVLVQEGVQPNEAYFIDDNEDNILQARKMGLAGLLYTDIAGTQADQRLKEVFENFLE